MKRLTFLISLRKIVFLGLFLIIMSINEQANAGVYDSNFELETEHFIVGYEYEETSDLAQKTADELEDVIWKKEIDELGFKSPLRYEGDKFRVYIDDADEELAHPRILGMTVATSDGEIYIVMSETIEDWDTYSNTLGHEFFHVIQYRYLSPEGESFESAPSSSFESGATWIESEIYPELDDYAYYMNVFFGQPNGSIFLAERPGLSYWEYSLAIWVEWIEQSLGVHVIDNFWTELYAFSQKDVDLTQSFTPYLAYRHVTSWENQSILETFHGFTVANINTDQMYAIGENLDDVFISGSYSNYPVEDSGGNYVSLFGSKYYRFYPESSEGNLKLTTSTDSNLGLLLSLVPLNDDGEILEEAVVKKLVPVGQGTGSLTLENAHQYDEVIAIVSPVDIDLESINTSEEIFYIDKDFSFEAEWTTEKPTEVTVEKISLPDSSPYSDLSTTHTNYKSIAYLSEKEVLQGYEDGTFLPENQINRAEFFKILVASLDVEIDPEIYQNCYPDVHDEWYAPYICYGTEQGWIQGYDDGYFRPEQTVNKVEAVKMLLESRSISTNDLTLLNYDLVPYTDIETDEWYYPYLQIAYGLKLLEETGTSLDPDGLRTRAAVSEETFRLTSLLDAQTMTPYTIFYSTDVDDIVIE